MPRVLVLTAGFGDGHNTAARNIRDAILAASAKSHVEIADFYAETNPHLNKAMQMGYRLAINRATRVWKAIFQLFDRPGVLERTLPLVAKLRDALAVRIERDNPDVLVSTYPIYSFLKREIEKRRKSEVAPLVTMVTDSTEINSAWFRCPSDHYIVIDAATKVRLSERGVDESRIHVLGFPVSLDFDSLSPLTAEDAGPPWRFLMLPSTKMAESLRVVRSVLKLETVSLTIVAGRNPRMQRWADDLAAKEERITAVGWTDQMPKLLASHHFFIGKAGGAIVQECFAAQCPILISHVVPGQEEGNIGLVLQYGTGALANTKALLTHQLEQAIGQEGCVWRRWKANLAANSKPGASRDIAKFVLKVAR